jgi:hypothetical protein
MFHITLFMQNFSQEKIQFWNAVLFFYFLLFPAKKTYIKPAFRAFILALN